MVAPDPITALATGGVTGVGVASGEALSLEDLDMFPALAATVTATVVTTNPSIMTTTNATAAITATTSILDDDDLGLNMGLGLGGGSVSGVGHCQQADDLLDFLLDDNGGSLGGGSIGIGCDQLVERTVEERKDGEGEAWSCAACTFANHPDLLSCEVCGTDRTGDGSDQSRRVPSTSSSSSSSSEQILAAEKRSGSASGLGLVSDLAPRFGYATMGGLNDVMTGDMLLDDLLSGNLEGKGTRASLDTGTRVMGIDDVVDDLLNDTSVGNNQDSSETEAPLPPAWTSSALSSSSSSHLSTQALALSPYPCSKVQTATTTGTHITIHPCIPFSYPHSSPLLPSPPHEPRHHTNTTLQTKSTPFR